jgi:hypothetical protein
MSKLHNDPCICAEIKIKTAIRNHYVAERFSQQFTFSQSPSCKYCIPRKTDDGYDVHIQSVRDEILYFTFAVTINNNTIVYKCENRVYHLEVHRYSVRAVRES